MKRTAHTRRAHPQDSSSLPHKIPDPEPEDPARRDGRICEAGDRLVEIHKLLEAEAPELARRRPDQARSVTVAGWAVSEAIRHLRLAFPMVGAKAAFRELVVATDWEYPGEVLSPPRPDFGAILRVCEARLEEAEGAFRQHLAEIHRKLDKAVRIDEEARRRRERNRELAAVIDPSRTRAVLRRRA